MPLRASSGARYIGDNGAAQRSCWIDLRAPSNRVALGKRGWSAPLDTTCPGPAPTSAKRGSPALYIMSIEIVDITRPYTLPFRRLRLGGALAVPFECARLGKDQRSHERKIPGFVDQGVTLVARRRSAQGLDGCARGWRRAGAVAVPSRRARFRQCTSGDAEARRQLARGNHRRRRNRHARRAYDEHVARSIARHDPLRRTDNARQRQQAHQRPGRILRAERHRDRVDDPLAQGRHIPQRQAFQGRGCRLHLPAHRRPEESAARRDRPEAGRP
jgi:hypothetical protein